VQGAFLTHLGGAALHSSTLSTYLPYDGHLYGCLYRPTETKHHLRVGGGGGDVVVWDNCPAQYQARQEYNLPQQPLMWRTTVKVETLF